MDRLALLGLTMKEAMMINTIVLLLIVLIFAVVNLLVDHYMALFLTSTALGWF